MSTRKSLLAVAVICGILLLMAGVAPVWAQSETPTSADPDAAAPAAVDAVPSMLLSYQGTLRDAGGALAADGSYNMTAAIYDNSTGTGTALWGPETHNGVQVRNGRFSLLLGNGSTPVAIPAELFSVATRYLLLTVGGNALTPGQRLASVPYAVSANYANSLAAPDGAPLAPVTVDNDGNLTVSNPYTLKFGSSTRQMVNLWSTTYGIGVQGNTQYFRSDSNFAWYMDGTHSDTELDPGTGGTAAMVLHDGKLGVGTTNPDHRVTVQAASTTGQWLSFKNSSGTTKWHVNSYNDTGLNVAETSVADGRLFIANGGNVGIGDTTPSAKLDVAGSVNINGHKPIIFRTYEATGHCYWHVWGSYSASTWSCGIVSFNVNADIDESGKQYPLMQAKAWVADNVWHFRVEAGESCDEDWRFTIMCVDNNLVQWDSAVPTQ